jgi:hypothetical protein
LSECRAGLWGRQAAGAGAANHQPMIYHRCSVCSCRAATSERLKTSYKMLLRPAEPPSWWQNSALFCELCAAGVGLQGPNEYVTEQSLRGRKVLAQGFETGHGGFLVRRQEKS